MKNSATKRTLALLLSMIFFVCSAGLTAFAAEGDVKTARIEVFANAYTQANSGDTVCSTSSYLLISNYNEEYDFGSTGKAAGTRRRTYLKFDMAAIDYSEIESAVLHLYFQQCSNTGTRVTMVFPVSTDWSADTITWNNAPDAYDYLEVDYIGTATNSRATTGAWTEIDISEYFQTLEADLAEVDLALYCDTAANYISSMETGDGNAPYIEVTYKEGDGVSDIVRDDITLKVLDTNGNTLVADEVITSVVEGRKYTYSETIDELMSLNGKLYQFDRDASTTEIASVSEEDNVVTLIYEELATDEDGFYTAEVYAFEDAYNAANDADTVQDSSKTLTLSGTEGSAAAKTIRNGYFKFDISMLNYKIIESATFDFNVTSSTNSGERTSTLYATETDWSDETLTYNNVPEVTSDALGSDVFINGTTGHRQIDISSYMNGLSRGVETVSFRMDVNTGANTVTACDAQDGNGAKLILKFSVLEDGYEEQYADVTIKTVDENGSRLKADEIVKDVEIGRTYYYTETPDTFFRTETTDYIYSEKDSTLSAKVESDGATIIIVYNSLEDGTLSDLTIETVTSDGVELADAQSVEALYVGETYYYTDDIDWVIEKDGVSYGFSSTYSTLSKEVEVDAANNVISLVYKPISTSTETGTKTATLEAFMDNYTESTSADTVMDDSSALIISSLEGEDPALADRDALIKFDLSDIAYERITSATLNFYINKGTNTGDRNTYVTATASSWTDGDVTWNNAPGRGEVIGYVTSAKTSSGKAYSVDVTSFIENLVSGEAEVSFRLYCDNGAVYIASQDAADGNAATLEITYVEGSASEVPRGSVIIRTVDDDGNVILDDVDAGDIVAGREYVYDETPSAIMTIDGKVYSYNSDASVKSLTVEADTENYIYIVYDYVPIYSGEENSISIGATDDAFIDDASKQVDTVQDASKTLLITGVNGSGKANSTREAMVKFDLSFLDIASVTSATFKVYITTSSNEGSRTMSVYPQTNDWSGDTVTWNNAPEYDTSEILGSSTYSKGTVGWVEFDITDYLNSLESLDEFSLRIGADTAVTYFSSVASGENVPTLELTFVAAGEEEEKTYADVTVRMVDIDGNDIYDPEVYQGIVGRKFTTPTEIPERFEKDGYAYVYDAASSVESINVTEDGDNEILLVYKKYVADRFYSDEILASDNAWMNASASSTVQDSSSSLIISSTAGDDPALAIRNALLKFDLSYINYESITSAKLKIYITAATNSAERETSVYVASSSDWSSDSVTWNNSPSAKGSAIGSVAFSGGTTGWQEIDLTEYFETIEEGTGEITLRLSVDTACNYIAAVGAGEDTAPRLDVDYIEQEGSVRSDITLRILDQEGNQLIADEIIEEDVPVDREWAYKETPDDIISVDGESYIYAPDRSTLSVTVVDGENYIILVYIKETSGEDIDITLKVEDDTFINESDPDTVQSHTSYLLSTSLSGSDPALATRDTLLKFNLADINFSEIKSATLRMYVTQATNSSSRTMTAYEIDSSWSGTTATWNNAPAKGEELGSVTFSAGSTGWKEIDITDYMNTLDSSTVDLSFRIASSTAANYIASIGGGTGNEAQLVLTYVNDGTAAVKERTSVYLKLMDSEGNLLEDAGVIAENIVVGSTYSYSGDIEKYVQYNGKSYAYSSSLSTTSVKVTSGVVNTIILVYEFATDGSIIEATITVSEDAYVDDGSPDTVMSTTSYLLATGTEGGNGAKSNRDPLLRFDLSEYQYSHIYEAKLRVYVNQSNNSTTRVTTAYPIYDEWSASTVTWNNAPSYSESEAMGSMSFANGTTGWQEIDVSDYFAEMDYTDEFSFRLVTDTGANYLASLAANDGNAAQLYIVYAEGEPTIRPRGTVVVKTVDENGNQLAEDITIKRVLADQEYTYTGTTTAVYSDGDVRRTFNAELSTLTVTIVADEENIITLVYTPVSADDIFDGYVIDDEGSWCWFADSRSLHHDNEELGINNTYVGYIDVHGSIKAMQYNHNTDEISYVLVRSNFQPDDHDNPAFLVLPDDRVMIIYSRHTDEKAFYYRISQVAGDITTLGEEHKLVTSANTTYPNPFILSDDPDHIYLCWRGTNWHPTIAQLSMPDENDEISFTWGPKQIVSSSAQSSGCRPYAKYVSDGVSKIHITYSATHPDNINPVSLYYNYIDINDMTVRDINGTVKATLSSSPFKVDNTETDSAFVVDDRSTSQRGWVWDIALDGDTPVIAMVRINSDKTQHDYYYAKYDWDTQSWTKTYIADGGGWFHQSSTEKCYSGGMSIDHDDPSIIYASYPVEGLFGEVYEIVKITMSEDGSEVVSREYITQNSEKNNIRPYAISGASDDEIKLVWLNGDYYYWIVNSSYKQGFPTSVRTNYELDDSGFAFEDGLEAWYPFTLSEGVSTYDRISGAEATLSNAEIADDAVTLTTSGSVTLPSDTFDGYESFTIAADVDFSASSGWGGTVFNLWGGKLKYTVNTSTYVPSLTIDGVTYESTNLWSNSDWNQSHSATTDGSTGTTNPGEVSFAITYDAESGLVRTFINGLIDQSINVSAGGLDMSGTNIIGSYAGEMRNLRIYSRALSAYEAMALAEGNNSGEEMSAQYETSVVYDAETDSVTATIGNNSSAERERRVYVAVYDEEGILIETVSKSVTIAGLSEAEVTVALSKEKPEKYVVKAFIWDDALTPSDEAYELYTSVE
ncbi:MAG: DNRLRE domain-containing protein [Clostridia bacterium]|nr:DNRLRE domain-containing protein [Clostridia bacterium]